MRRAAPLLGNLAVLIAAAPAYAADPPVPLGQDPGGEAIAILTEGIDYRDPAIAARLARDGEGEIAGWDFVDGDNRPFAANPDETALAKTLAAQGATRLIVVRYDANDPVSLARAVAFAGATPARRVSLSLGAKPRAFWEPFKQALTHFSELRVLVPRCADANTPAAAPDAATVFPEQLGLPNVIAAPCAAARP